MDVVTYALCKKIASSAVSGVKDISIDGLDLIIETNDGQTLTMKFPKPADGVDGINGADGKDGKDGINGTDGLSIVNVKVNENNHLVCTMSDGSEIDAGALPTTSTGGTVNPSDLEYATEEDIDKMFDGLTPINPDRVDYATKEDIDKMFTDLNPIDPDKVDYATKEDIDKLFK